MTESNFEIMDIVSHTAYGICMVLDYRTFLSVRTDYKLLTKDRKIEMAYTSQNMTFVRDGESDFERLFAVNTNTPTP